MGALLAFAPFLAFAVVTRFAGAAWGLQAAAVLSLCLVAWDIVGRKRSPKILEIGSLVLFGALAIYTLAARPEWSVAGVRLFVDGGLLLIVLISIGVRQPFTLQYAREATDPSIWQHPAFKRANYIITAVWALAFAAMVLADLLWVYVPTLPPMVGVIVTIAALVGAVKFTSWYPARARARAGA